VPVPPSRFAVVASVVAGALALAGCGASHPSQAEPRRSGTATSATPSQRGTPTPATTGSSRHTGGTATAGHPSSRPITLAFGGDTHFMGVDATRLAADPATAMGPVAGVLRRADFAMVNLETAVTERGTPAPKQFTFHAPATAFRALRSAGVDAVTMANNHGMDYGVTGLRDSLAAARAARFPVVGIGQDEDAAFRPYRVTVKGHRLAIVGATQVLDDNLVSSWTAGPSKPGLASAKDVARVVAAVRAARAGSDTVIVYLHYGRELENCPTSDQQDIAARLVAAGADIVVGSHAHVVLGGGWRGSAYVDYGLGNFVFYSSSGPTAESGVLELRVAGRAVTRARWVPATLQGGVPVPLRGASAAAARRHWVGLRSCTGLASRPG